MRLSLLLAALVALAAPAALAQPVLPYVLINSVAGDNISVNSDGPFVARDADANTYVAGDFQGTVDFEPADPQDDDDTFSSGGSNNAAFIASYDGAGALRWVVVLPALGNTFYSVDAVAVGEAEVFITGGAGLPDFDPGPGTATPDGSNYVAAYDRTTGAFRWVNGRGAVAGVALAALDGRVVVAGNFTDRTVDFDPGPGTFELTASGPTTWVASYAASDGAFGWAGVIAATNGVDQYSSGSTRQTPGLAAAGDRVAVTGYFVGTVDLDPGAAEQPRPSAGSGDAYVSVLDAASGAFSWGLAIGSGGSDRAVAAAADGASIYLVGRVDAPADFDPGAGTATLTQGAFIAAYDRTTGAYRWADGFSRQVVWRDVAADGARVVAAGTFRGAPDLDPGPGTATLTATPSGGSSLRDDIVLAAYGASDGGYVWADGLGNTPDDDRASSVAVSRGRVAVTGQFRGTSTGDFDPGPGTVAVPMATRAYAAFYDAATGAYAPLPVAGEPSASARGLALTVAPNPARGSAAVTLALDAPQSASVRVFDLLGRRVAVLHDGPLSAGPHTFRLDAALPAGVYVVRASAGAEALVRRVTVVR